MPPVVEAPVVQAAAPEEPVLEAREEEEAPQQQPTLQHLNKASQEYVYEKLKNFVQKDDSEQEEREFIPRKLSSPANYEESNLSQEFKA